MNASERADDFSSRAKARESGRLLMPRTVLANRYVLDGHLGSGGTATVFDAHDRLLERRVAIKVLSSHKIELSLRNEARAALELTHPNIVRIYNYERDAELEFIVMEYVNGEDSRLVCRRHPGGFFSAATTLRIGIECLQALDYAHGLGFVHRDVKPSNILLDRGGGVKLCDFGLMEHVEAFSSSSLSAGTPGYLAPEHIRGERWDTRGDLYSLGATLYALGNGAPPFGTELGAALHGHLRESVPPSQHLPSAVHGVLVRALAKDPNARFRSAAEMMNALEEARTALLHALPDSRHLAAMPAREPTSRAARAPHARRAEALHPDEPSAAAALDRGDESISITFEEDALLELVAEPPHREVARAAEARRDGMVQIPECRLASAYGGDKLVVRPFFLDRTEVTNDAYARFVEEIDVVPPAHWLGRAPPHGEGAHPVVGVSLREALAYAAWAGKRLPTAHEWEAAARRPDGRTFPWGEWAPAACNGPDAQRKGTSAVTSYVGGASVDGVLDLIGNVWEWTYDPDDGNGSAPAERAYAFGGSYRHPCVTRGHIARSEVAIERQYLYLGFRCALNA